MKPIEKSEKNRSIIDNYEHIVSRIKELKGMTKVL